MPSLSVKGQDPACSWLCFSQEWRRLHRLYKKKAYPVLPSAPPHSLLGQQELNIRSNRSDLERSKDASFGGEISEKEGLKRGKMDKKGIKDDKC